MCVHGDNRQNPNNLIWIYSLAFIIKDILRDIHLALVNVSIRQRVNILASGGIAMAEHVNICQPFFYKPFPDLCFKSIYIDNLL